jgi:hypothetical protein
MDPDLDADPDPAIFAIDLQDNKSILRLMDPDPDAGGPKTCGGSGGTGPDSDPQHWLLHINGIVA